MGRHRGGWCDSTIPNCVLAPAKDKSDGTKDSVYEELSVYQGSSISSLICHMKILLEDFSSKI
jgi:hypothetical protein